MSKAAKSVFVFGIYLVVNGLGFLLIPNTMLGSLGVSSTNEPWIQVVGMLLLFLAYYYIMSARNELVILFRWSIYARSSVIIFFTAFVILGIAPAILIIFGAIDVLGAIWTTFALKTK